jgi:hypothetical protein
MTLLVLTDFSERNPWKRSYHVRAVSSWSSDTSQEQVVRCGKVSTLYYLTPGLCGLYCVPARCTEMIVRVLAIEQL